MSQPIKQLTAQQKSQLVKMTESKLAKMHQDKKQAPSLIIPRAIIAFSKTQSYKKFMYGAFNYCKMFNQTIKKYDHLRQKMQGRVGEDVMLLQRERDDLGNMEKQLSYLYAQVLLAHTSKSVYKDQFFFQTLIYLLSRVIKQFFTRDDFVVIQEEINRLFRTNRYNLIRKRHENDRIMKEFPILKQQTKRKKINLNTIISKVPQKVIALRQLQKKKRWSKSQKDYTTLLGITQMKDQNQRSPLLCTWLPSRKSMLSQFTRPKAHSLFKQVAQEDDQ